MGLQLVSPNTNINFVGLKKIAFIFSLSLILIGLFSLVVKGGLKYGIDFAGGVVVQIRFEDKIELDELKHILKEKGVHGISVQRFGAAGEHEYLLRSVLASDKDGSKTLRLQVTQALNSKYAGAYEIQRLEMVGPKVGADLRSKALEAMFYAVLLIAIYISGRFEKRWWTAGFMAAGLAGGIYLLQLLSLPKEYLIFAAMFITLALCWYLKLSYALGAVVALIHDVLVTIGLFSLLDKEFDLTIVAALLTIIGYSLNDTIIIFDRVRANLRGKMNGQPLPAVINKSVNQTLSRTLLTSGTTLFVVLALFFFGGGVIHDFALALLVGVIIGTYSSIYIASTILLGFGVQAEEDEKNGDGKDSMGAVV